ncbi:IS5 family transposase [Planctomycetes bacterium K23_9]|uniref:Transposase DDE domain protein n=1 Tax=Stieleria marina TaxID=1930275 RepID=A0A517NMH8_9BACT|nr:Transposase DDE domain protein [Planctomycetes bacterium K23_9]
MSRHDLTDDAWNAIRYLMPSRSKSRRGRPWFDHRQLINGVLWILQTGAPWRDLPVEFGNWKTVYNRFRRWVKEGLWDKLFRKLLRRMDQLGNIDRTVWCVDATVTRAHRSAAGMAKQSEENDKTHALGRSRGGYSTKLHVMTDARGTLLSITATGGQRHESQEFDNLYEHCQVSVHFYRDRPAAIAGDKDYGSAAIRESIENRSIEAVMPTRANETVNEEFDRDCYRKRNIVERLIGWLRESRRIATRYDKLPESYLAFIKLAAIRRMLKCI